MEDTVISVISVPFMTVIVVSFEGYHSIDENAYEQWLRSLASKLQLQLQWSSSLNDLIMDGESFFCRKTAQNESMTSTWITS